jgi:hypothetical protein
MLFPDDTNGPNLTFVPAAANVFFAPKLRDAALCAKVDFSRWAVYQVNGRLLVILREKSLKTL